MSSEPETMRVLMTQLVPTPAIERLREVVGEEGVLDINPEPDRIWSKQELIEKLRAGSYNALYCLLTNPIDAEVMDAAPDLKIIANMAVGYNNIDVVEATRRGIPVSNTPGVLTDTTADFARALLMCPGPPGGRGRPLHAGGALPRLGPADAGWGRMSARQDPGYHRFRAHRPRPRQTGRRLRYAGALLRPLPRRRRYQRTLRARPVEMDELLAQSDYVSIHTDYNPETHHLIGAPELARMKSTAYLINTSRGACVDEAALSKP